jgi:hypothetical protein
MMADGGGTADEFHDFSRDSSYRICRRCARKSGSISSRFLFIANMVRAHASFSATNPILIQSRDDGSQVRSFRQQIELPGQLAGDFAAVNRIAKADVIALLNQTLPGSLRRQRLQTGTEFVSIMAPFDAPL